MNRKIILLGPLLLIVMWVAASVSGFFSSFFLPTPWQVGEALFSLLATGKIVPDIIITIERVAVAFSIALAVGLPAGLALGSSKRVYDSVEFVVDFFRSLPATAIFPLFLLVFGIGDESKIAVTAFAAALIIIFNTAHGVMHSNRTRLLAARLMGATKAQIFRHISFWESLPQTFAGIRIALSLTLVIVIVTEMFIGTYAGLGKLIIDFQYVYNIPGMYAVIIVAGLMGYGLNMALAGLEKRVVHWSGK